MKKPFCQQITFLLFQAGIFFRPLTLHNLEDGMMEIALKPIAGEHFLLQPRRESVTGQLSEHLIFIIFIKINVALLHYICVVYTNAYFDPRG
jgi:hypothetical protein